LNRKRAALAACFHTSKLAFLAQFGASLLETKSK
jgi:hypothetical protein